MSREIICLASYASGMAHRMALLYCAKAFADYFAYTVRLLWGVSSGVAFCRFEELLSAFPGVGIVNISEPEVTRLTLAAGNSAAVSYGGHSYQVVRKGSTASERMFCYDLRAARVLWDLIPPSYRPKAYLKAVPTPVIQSHIVPYIKQRQIATRVGIRVRVTESPTDRRKPHRTVRELDDVVRSIASLPWHTRVFVVTDSEYVQQMLASHFFDCLFLRKHFDLREGGTSYVHRQSKHELVTFLKEVMCLCACSRIIDIGGFLNHNSVSSKIIRAPYREVFM